MQKSSLHGFAPLKWRILSSVNLWGIFLVTAFLNFNIYIISYFFHQYWFFRSVIVTHDNLGICRNRSLFCQNKACSYPFNLFSLFWPPLLSIQLVDPRRQGAVVSLYLALTREVPAFSHSSGVITHTHHVQPTMMGRSGATLRWTILPLGGDIAMKTAAPLRPILTGVRKILGSTYVEMFVWRSQTPATPREPAILVITYTYVETPVWRSGNLVMNHVLMMVDSTCVEPYAQRPHVQAVM